MNIINFIKRYPVWIFFILTFAISWGGLLLAIGGPNALIASTDTNQFEKILPFAILALLAGPSFTGILLIWLIDGKEGFRFFVSRLLKWRVGAKSYSLAILTAPLLLSTLFIFLSLFSTKFIPGIFTVENKVAHFIMGFITGVMAGFFEEIGWTGFVIPKLRKRLDVFGTGLVLGIVWAVWHILPAFWLGFASRTITGPLSMISYILDPFLFLIAFRILMVWVYDITGSLLMGVLMHISLTASTRIFTPPGIAGLPLITFDLTWFFVLCIIIVTIILINHKKNSSGLYL